MIKSKELMAVHIEQWSASGLSKAAYCRQVGITYHSFLHHFNKSAKAEDSSGFTLLEPAKAVALIKLHLPNGCYFSLTEDCSLSMLQKLVQLC